MNHTGIALGGIDPTFDYVVSLLAPKHFMLTASQFESFDAMKKDYFAKGHITVNVNYSDHTIFGQPSTNWQFRAWHDMCHISMDADFSDAGENLAADLMMTQVNSLMGPTETDVQRWTAIIHTEVVGQLEYFREFGDFPTDQRQFAIDYLKLRHGLDVATFPKDCSNLTIQY